MNSSGRVCVIGSISEYNLTETPSSIPLFCSCMNQTACSIASYSLCACLKLCFKNVFLARPITGIILSKQLKIQGFAVVYTLAKWPVAFKEMEKWIAEVS